MVIDKNIRVRMYDSMTFHKMVNEHYLIIYIPDKTFQR